MAADGFLGARSARASVQDYCINKSLAAGSRGRCSFPLALLNQVDSFSDDGGGISHCAIGKDDADGGGGNAISPSCGTAQYLITACVAGSWGYPYTINQSSARHTFNGEVGYSGSCIP
jgi:hypothetical protein